VRVADGIRQLLQAARRSAAKGNDESAKQAYLDILRYDPTHFAALIELGALATTSGHRSAACTVYLQAVQHHPDNPIGHVNLANLLLDAGDLTTARQHYEAALRIAPDLPEAHQGMARVLTELDDATADLHWQKGFVNHAVVTKPYRGTGSGVPLLLLVAARGGNIPTRHWIDDHHFAITAIYADFHDPELPLPPHALVVNAIGDADMCGTALARAEQMLARDTAPLINPPARVRVTGRADNARRLANLPGVVTPRITILPRTAIQTAEALRFPLLLRAPGFHTGRHFVTVEHRDALAKAAADMPGEELLAIEYLDAHGLDGMARKYRVMFVDGTLYPLHLAISHDWKVHYFTAAMATSAIHREEERRFLDNMPAVLGERAMTALAAIDAKLGLDYAGVDFALAQDGSVLLFEANATMVVKPPEPDPIWDYRRNAIAKVLEAAEQMLSSRVNPVHLARLRGWAAKRTDAARSAG
jgi:glutathione synthase/RimK-type ligase-like ATP-grasp enzyme